MITAPCPAQVAELTRIVAAAKAATTTAELDAVWLDMADMDVYFEFRGEESGQPVEVARAAVLQAVREECEDDDIDPAAVGLDDASA